MSGITSWVTKSSNYIRGFIDGVMKSYVYNTSSTTLNFFVGANNGAESMTGYVSNVRLVTGGSNSISNIRFNKRDSLYSNLL